MTVEPLFAQWLQAPGFWSTRIGSAAATWGESALTAERATGIAFKGDAEVESDRQLAFLARGPFVVEVHQLSGTDWTSRLGQVVTLTIDQLGYDQGLDVFVLEAEADHARGLSQVAVLRSLKDGGAPTAATRSATPVATIDNTPGESALPGYAVVGFDTPAEALAARLAALAPVSAQASAATTGNTPGKSTLAGTAVAGFTGAADAIDTRLNALGVGA